MGKEIDIKRLMAEVFFWVKAREIGNMWERIMKKYGYLEEDEEDS